MQGAGAHAMRVQRFKRLFEASHVAARLFEMHGQCFAKLGVFRCLDDFRQYFQYLLFGVVNIPELVFE